MGGVDQRQWTRRSKGAATNAITRLQLKGAGGIRQRRRSKGHRRRKKIASAAPFDLLHNAAAAVVPTERERVVFVCPVGGGGWLWWLVHALPTGPNGAGAKLLIRPTVTAGVRMQSVLRSARQLNTAFYGSTLRT